MPDLITGSCTGGPLDQEQVTVRTATFVAVDRAAGRSWVYRHTGDGFAVCTDHDDSLIYPEGPQTGARVFDPDRGWTAGENSQLDIIAVGA